MIYLFNKLFSTIWIPIDGKLYPLGVQNYE